MTTRTILGIEGILYRNTATWGSPTWNPIPNCKDLSLTLEKGEAGANTRFTKWKLSRGAMIDSGVEFGMVYDPGDSDYQALKAAFFAGTVINFAIADGDIAVTGTEYLKVDCEVMKFNIPQNLEEVMSVEVAIKPARTDNAPAWTTV